MIDVDGNTLFQVDTAGKVYLKGPLQGILTSGGAATPVNAYAYNVSAYGPVIDAAGNWVGKPITTGGQAQSPWTQHIQAAGFALLGSGTVQSGQFMLNSGTLVIDGNGHFVGPGIDVSKFGIACGYLTTKNAGGAGQIDTVTLSASGNIAASGGVYAGGFYGGPFQGSSISISGSANVSGGYDGGAFRGAGVAVGAQGIGCGYLSTNQLPGNANYITTGDVLASGSVKTNNLYLGGHASADATGTWFGSVLNYTDITGTRIGISGVAFGTTESVSFTFATPGGGQQTVTLRFNSGIYLGH
jgi:hypothetical protein